MADTNRSSSTTLPRARWLALPAALFALIGVLLWWRRGHKEALVPFAAPIPDVPLTPKISAEVIVPVPIPQAKLSQRQSSRRWLLYIGATLFFVVLLLALQSVKSELSALIFLIILLAAVSYSLAQSANRIKQQATIIRNELMHPWKLIKQQADAVSFVMIGVALFCAIGCTYVFKDSITYAPIFGQGVLLLGISFAAFTVVLMLKPNVLLPQRWRGSTAISGRQIQPVSLGGAFGGLALTLSGIGLLFLLAQSNYNIMDSSIFQHVHHVVQFAFLVLGIILLVVGLGGRLQLPVMAQRELLYLSLVLMLGVILRVVILDSVLHRFIDEVNFMDAIPRLWAKPDTPILFPFSELTAFTWLYPMFQSATSNIVGSGLIGLRLISVTFGTLGIAALYFLVRTLFHDKWLALIAALILATFPAHLHFSRLGLNNIADPFFGTLALAFLMRGLQSHSRSDYLIAGAALGLTQYFYEGGRLLFPPLLIAAFIVSWLLTGHRKVDLVHAGYGLLVAVLIAAPVYYTLLGTNNFLAPRLNRESLKVNFLASLGSGASIFDIIHERFLYPLLMYTNVWDQSWFYGAQQGFVLLPFVPLFLLGVVYAFRTIRTPGMIVLLVWGLITALGNGLLQDNLWAPRYVVVFPALAVFLAVGIYATFTLLWPRLKALRWRYVAIAALTIYIAAAQTVYYFRDYIPFYLTNFQLDEDWNDAIFRMIDLPAGTHVHFIMDAPIWYINIESVEGYYRLNLDVDSLRPDQVTTDYLKKITADPAIKHVFFMKVDKKDVLTELQHYFTVSEPQFSSQNNVPLRNQLALYNAIVTVH